MSLTQQLVSQINAKPISEEDLHAAALFLLDGLASAYAGSQTEVGQKFLAWAKTSGDSPRTKAFLLGCLTHITETDDLHRASVTHPGCLVIPAVLAIAEQKNISDREALIAMIKGFEAVCRVGMSVGPQHYKVWHNTATCGPFGSAMAAAHLLGLSEEQTVFAMGNAGTQSSGLWQFLNTGAMSKHLHAGRGSEAGMLAAELATFDVTGAADILEGEKGFYKGLCPDPVPTMLDIPEGAPWQVHQTSIKPWPSCRHTHPTIDASLEAHAQIGNSMIKEVHVETYQAALDLCDREVSVNEYQAKFSLQHCASIALLQGHVGLGSFDGQAREDAASAAKKVTVASVEPYKSNYPRAWGSKVTVITDDDRRIEAQRESCKGDPEAPLDRAEMLEKAQGLLATAGLSKDAANSICQQVLAMPDSGVATPLYPQFEKLRG